MQLVNKWSNYMANAIPVTGDATPTDKMKTVKARDSKKGSEGVKNTVGTEKGAVQTISGHTRVNN